MCGIVGTIRRPGARGAPAVDPSSMLRCLAHRGPDSQGEYVDGPVWLGHARLSIIDLSAAANQPMTTPNARMVISYNGEVYNFADVAADLDLRDLRTHSDTEVVLRAFERHGTGSLPYLNGMYAFALYDRDAQRLWLVRDRLGIKPLYYRLDDLGLAFASEIEPLRAAREAVPECDIAALHEWVYYGTTLGERTLYKDIRKLPPGHFLELDVATFEHRIASYWSPRQYAAAPKVGGSDADHIVETRRLLEQAVRRQLVSDVPVGIFLSGGLDSSAITAFASKHYHGKLATFSVGFDFDQGVNELPKARIVAERFGTDHHELQLSGYEIADVMERLVDHHGAPFSDAANIPLYLLAAKISGCTKVVLQGDGGDELFGGYRRYTTLSFLGAARMLARAGRVVNAFTPRNTAYYRRRRQIDALLGSERGTMLALLMTEEDEASHPEHIFAPGFRRQVAASDPFARYRECHAYFAEEDAVNQMLLVDSMIILPDTFLEKVDRSTMAASVEVRVPFLDNDLVDYCMRLSGPQKVRAGQKKWLLKKALDGIVPDEILHGKKTGFGVPYGFWLRQALRELFFDHLQAFERAYPDVLDGSVVRAMYEDHATGRRDRAFLLWKVLNFMIWANRAPVRFGP